MIYLNIIIDIVSLIMFTSLMLYCIDGAIKVIKNKNNYIKKQKTSIMKSFFNELKKSVNWKSYMLYVILFNFVLLYSNWNLHTFILLNTMFIIIILGLYFIRKTEIKQIEKKSEKVYEELNEELKYYDLNMSYINDQKRKGELNMDDYEKLINKERHDLIKFYIEVLNKNM